MASLGAIFGYDGACVYHIVLVHCFASAISSGDLNSGIYGIDSHHWTRLPSAVLRQPNLGSGSHVW